MMLLFLSAEAYSAQNVRIDVPEVIYSAERIFTLGQVSKITGGNVRTRRLLEGLNVYADGDRLARREVLRAINDSEASDARIELYMPQYSRIEAPDYEGNFTETSAPQERTPQNASSLAPVIKSLASWTGDVEVSASSPVPEGTLIDPASMIPGTPAATLRFKDGNGRVKSLPVRLTWTQNVMVASHNIRKGDRIYPRDVFSRPMKITRPGMYASTPEEISGFTANRAVKQGEPIELRNLTSSLVVRKNRPVKIVARYGAATATIDGITLEEGKPGEWVKVRRADDRHVTLRARIIDENTVEVHVE